MSPLLKRLRGALIAVPIVNIYGFVAQTRYLPDRRDLNRCFPGSAKGSTEQAETTIAMVDSATSQRFTGKGYGGVVRLPGI